MIAGCVVSNQRYNGSFCCSQYFVQSKLINEFGSCTATLQKNIQSETIASSQRGFTILVQENEDDKIGTFHVLNWLQQNFISYSNVC